MTVRAVLAIAGFLRRRPLVVYFVLACGFSWAYWIPLALFAPHVSHFPGLLGPMLAALLMTAIQDGQSGLRRLFDQAVRWRVRPVWYILALGPALIGVLALVAAAVAGLGWPTLTGLSVMDGVPEIGLVGLFVVLLIVNGYGEETGWRGYAWPRLRQRHGIGTAALLLAVPWAIWHIPTFWLETGLADMPLTTIPGWLFALPFGAVVLGWLYERSHCSLWIVALFHANLNWASATPATEGLPAMIVSVLIIAGGSAILVHTRIRHRRQLGEGDS